RCSASLPRCRFAWRWMRHAASCWSSSRFRSSGWARPARPRSARQRQWSMSSHPYEVLGPDVVLDALERVGLRGDGRLMALSSYENRVYQAYLEEPVEGHTAVVAKFYRPGRWSEAQILEEHAFSAE